MLLDPVPPASLEALRSTTGGGVRMQSAISRRRAAARADGGAAYAGRRAQIVATAARIFREKGFRGASLADVAESLGTDRASLYYYIGSKEELFHEIVRDAAEAAAQQAEEIRDGAGSAPASWAV